MYLYFLQLITNQTRLRKNLILQSEPLLPTPNTKKRSRWNIAIYSSLIQVNSHCRFVIKTKNIRCILLNITSLLTLLLHRDRNRLENHQTIHLPASNKSSKSWLQKKSTAKNRMDEQVDVTYQQNTEWHY